MCIRDRSKTTVSDGTNTKVTSTVAKDGHTDYKVNLNKDCLLYTSSPLPPAGIGMGEVSGGR